MAVNDFLYIALTFFCGALPFSLWIGRLASGTDIRTVGDGNPGGTNVIRAGGVRWGVLAIVLDMLKATIPVGYAWWFMQPTPPYWTMVAIAVAPIFGHAFSPFLRFRGGKAVATTGGTWIGLTVYEFITVGGLLLLYWYKSVIISGWAVILMMLSTLVYILLAHNDPVFLPVWVINFVLLVYTHRADLRQLPGVRGWVRRAARALTGRRNAEAS